MDGRGQAALQRCGGGACIQPSSHPTVHSSTTRAPCADSRACHGLSCAAEYAHSQGAGAVRQEAIVAEVRAAARAKVPDGLKAELLTRIRAALEA